MIRWAIIRIKILKIVKMIFKTIWFIASSIFQSFLIITSSRIRSYTLNMVNCMIIKSLINKKTKKKSDHKVKVKILNFLDRLLKTQEYSLVYSGRHIQVWRGCVGFLLTILNLKKEDIKIKNYKST